MPVSATSPFTTRSHCSACCLTRKSPCAALARVSAALARDSKPLSMLRPVRRAVSARELASRRVSASRASHARRPMYWLAVSAATITRASCHVASAPPSRASAASRAARLPPKTSSSQLACKPALLVVARGRTRSWRPRLALAVASSRGSSAASAPVRVARASAMRAPALAIEGLTASAATTRWASKGSSNCDHHWSSSARRPPCGKGACHAGATKALLSGTAGALAQAASAAATAQVRKASRIMGGEVYGVARPPRPPAGVAATATVSGFERRPRAR